MKSLRRGGAVVVERYIFDLTAPVLGHLVEQEPIHRTADAEREHASVRVLLNFRDDLHIVADVTVGHEAHYANMILRVRRIKRSANRLHHLGTAFTAAVCEECLSLRKICWRGRNGLPEQDACIARKSDQVKGVL